MEKPVKIFPLDFPGDGLHKKDMVKLLQDILFLRNKKNGFVVSNRVALNSEIHWSIMMFPKNG